MNTQKIAKRMDQNLNNKHTYIYSKSKNWSVLFWIIMRLHEKEVDAFVDWLMGLVWYHCEFCCKNIYVIL